MAAGAERNVRHALQGLRVARNATVEIKSAGDDHLGVGLLLDVPGRGPVVLTCHHVVTLVAPDELRVLVGGEAREATFDEDASRIERDLAVLDIAPPPPVVVNPMLHVPDHATFSGRLDAHAIAPGMGDFHATLTLGTSVDFDAVQGGRRYHLPDAFALDSDDSRPGVSGSPVYCEWGILGLIHAARAEGPRVGRKAYLNPISAWTEGLPALKAHIHPFATSKLRERADVSWAGGVASPRLDIPGLRPDLYVPRPEDDHAKSAFAEGGVCLVGRPRSGKTRIVHNLLREGRDDVMVVVPGRMAPPETLTGEDLEDRDVILVFDNLHMAVNDIKPLWWCEQLRAVGARPKVVVTTCNGKRWTAVRNVLAALPNAGPKPVYLSPKEGKNLSRRAAWQLAQELGMDRETFSRRFTGTPGSLTSEQDAAPERSGELPAGAKAGIAILPPTEGQVPAAIPHNLPSVNSSFVGREAERRALDGLLSAASLVTITGRMGAGKTRLAVHVATELADRFPDGVWYADLSAARAAEQVVPIVQASTQTPRTAQDHAASAIVRHLRNRRALVVLNGADEVRDAAASLLRQLTGDGADVRVLATARQALGIEWENVFPLTPFRDGGEAERLFFERMTGGSGEVALTDHERSEARSLCESVDGLPGALEVTAAQVRDTGVERTAEADRRQRESGAPAPADPLALAVQRSLGDLSPAEAAVFGRLGAMPDWFTLEAACAVAANGHVAAADVPHCLRRLVDRALVVIDDRIRDEQRYRLLPSLRQLASERLEAAGEAEDARRRHADHYLDVAERAARRIEGQAAQRWAERLARERVHLRTAFAWALANELSIGLRLGAALWRSWVFRARFAHGRRRLEELLGAAMPRLDELSPDDVGALLEVAAGAAYLAYHQADYPGAERHVEQVFAVRERGDAPPSRGDEHDVRGLVARRRCEHDRAVDLLTDAIGLSDQMGDLPRLADRLNTLGNVVRERAVDRADLDEAATLQDRSFRVYSRLGSRRGCAMVQSDLAYVLMDREDYAGARAEFMRALTERRAIDDPQGIGQSLNGLGALDRRQGRYKSAIARHNRALELFDRMGDRLRTAESLELLGLANLYAGHGKRGHELLDRGLALREAMGAPRPPSLVAVVETAVESAARGLKGTSRASGPSPPHG
jgi:predicted ATPase